MEQSAIRLVLPTLIFDTFLPTVDSVSDLILILRWYTTGHVKYATAMAIPFLMNSCFNIYQWWKWDSKYEKRFTWILLIFQLWPVYRAIKLIIHLYKKTPNAQEEKMKFERQIVSLEPYLESVPSLFVMSLALYTTGHTPGYAPNNPENYETLIGNSITLFWTKLFISLVTSSIGVSKYLLKGPCRVLSNDGYLNGMVTWKYLMAFISTLCSLGGKLILATYLFIVPFTFQYTLPSAEKSLLVTNQTIQNLNNISFNATHENLSREIYKREVIDMSSEEMLSSNLYNTEVMMSDYNFSVYGFNYDDMDYGTAGNIESTNDDYSGVVNITDVFTNTASAQTLNVSQEYIEAFNASVHHNINLNNNLSQLYAQSLLIVFGFTILPQLIMSFTAIFYVTRCPKMFLNVVCAHPQMWLLPVFTYFTIGPKTMSCFPRRQDAKISTKLAFSRWLTLFNMILTYTFFVLGWVTTGSLRSTSDFAPLFFKLASFIFFLYAIPGLLFTTIFLGSCNCSCKLERHDIDVNDMNGSSKGFDSIHAINKRINCLENKTEHGTTRLGEGCKAKEIRFNEFSRRQTL